jgi:DNA-binding response OmpR family regulator
MNSWYVAPSKVLIAEDDGDLLAVIGFALHNAGFEAIKVSNGSDALRAFAEQTFALLVLDINMPEINGLQVCTRVREQSSVPVLMLSARDQERDLLQALDAGADAYMVKPFSPRALIAHIRALLRRSSLSEAKGLQVGSVKLEVEGRALRLPSGEIRLTKLETRLLQLLMLNAGQTVSTKHLIAEVWNTYSTANRNMLKQVVFRLRRKLAHDVAATQALQTTPDGYVWNSEVSATAHSVSAPAAAATVTALNC